MGESIVFYLVAQVVKNPPAMQETLLPFLSQETPLEKDRLPTPVFLDFPSGSHGKESACLVGDLGLAPGLGRSHSSVLAWRIPMDRGAWQAIVCEVAKSWTRLGD